MVRRLTQLRTSTLILFALVIFLMVMTNLLSGCGEFQAIAPAAGEGESVTTLEGRRGDAFVAMTEKYNQAILKCSLFVGENGQSFPEGTEPDDEFRINLLEMDFMNRDHQLYTELDALEVTATVNIIEVVLVESLFHTVVYGAGNVASYTLRNTPVLYVDSELAIFRNDVGVVTRSNSNGQLAEIYERIPINLINQSIQTEAQVTSTHRTPEPTEEEGDGSIGVRHRDVAREVSSSIEISVQVRCDYETEPKAEFADEFVNQSL